MIGQIRYILLFWGPKKGKPRLYTFDTELILTIKPLKVPIAGAKGLIYW